MDSKTSIAIMVPRLMVQLEVPNTQIAVMPLIDNLDVLEVPCPTLTCVP